MVETIERTPLEAWVRARINRERAAQGELTRQQIEQYQFKKLQETVELAKTRSIFYRRRLAGMKTPPAGPADISRLPFTTADDIRQNPMHFLCVSQSEISRVITLQSSGTTGIPKRLFFTAGDQELTIDFFQYGMSTLVKPGMRVLILLPGEMPGSVGYLLRTGLERSGVDGIVHGPVRDVPHTLDVIRQEHVDALVGIPSQVLALARYRDNGGKPVPVKLHSVLLSTDHVPDAIVRELEASWGCRVFNHYGMTEMGLGGAVECQALNGYHLREADLYFEIIEPESGQPLPDGETGEVVFTTLTRQGMPLIRYRTGDISRFIPEPCPCGTVLKRMDRVKSRLGGRIELAKDCFLTMAQLDEALFPLQGLLDFKAELNSDEGRDILSVRVSTDSMAGEEFKTKVYLALAFIPEIKAALRTGRLEIASVLTEAYQCNTNGTAKRTVCDRRQAAGDAEHKMKAEQ